VENIVESVQNAPLPDSAERKEEFHKHDAQGSWGRKELAARVDELRRAVLADPHPVWLDAITQVMQRGDVEVVAQATPGAEALAVLEELRPELLITELSMQGGELDGPAYVREARMRSSETRIIVLSAGTDVNAVQDVLLAGASAYVVKTARPEDLLSAVRQTFEHSVFLAPADFLGHASSTARNGTEPDPKLNDLTRREVEILRLVADGLTNAQLARMLWLSEQTVKFHLSNVYRKLGVANRTEASRWAQVHGVLAA
jgi:two-component system nitrate/nitrite response regulator NarL